MAFRNSNSRLAVAGLASKPKRVPWLNPRSVSRESRSRAQRGYMLITLMLWFALMTIALLAVLPRMKQQIQRDREAELCHRGTMYMRAIQHYFKRFGRYPSRIEDLENTNNVRFLRKRYKDPFSRDPQSGKDRDFKLMHVQDVMLNNGPALGGAAGLAGQAGLGGLGGQGGLAGLAGQGGLGGLAGLASAAGLGGMTGQLGGQGQSGFQLSSGLQSQISQMSAMQTAGQGGISNLNGNSGSSDSSSNGNDQGGSSSGSSGSNQNGPNGSSSANGGLNGQVFGGGPILGVASNSKDKSIREYNKKNHYNDWYFIYDPNYDRGGLLVGPWQPIQIGGANGTMPGMNGTTGTGLGQGLGQGQGLSQPGGFGGGLSQPGGFGQSGNTQQQTPQTQQNPQN